MRISDWSSDVGSSDRRIEREKALRHAQIAQRHASETAEISAGEDVERARLVSERQLREARIVAEEETAVREAARGQSVESAHLPAPQALAATRLAQAQPLNNVRIYRDRPLPTQHL